MIIDSELRKKLTRHLPSDYQKQGAKATGFSRSMIYKVLSGLVEQDEIAEWLIHKALQIKNDKDKKRSKLSEIAKEL